MVIYGEYLFLENFLTGLIITYFTGRIAGAAAGRLRLLLCGLLCGAFSFTMFAALPGAVTAASKLLFAFAAAAAAFGWQGLRRTAFLAASFPDRDGVLRRNCRGIIILLWLAGRCRQLRGLPAGSYLPDGQRGGHLRPAVFAAGRGTDPRQKAGGSNFDGGLRFHGRTALAADRVSSIRETCCGSLCRGNR